MSTARCQTRSMRHQLVSALLLIGLLASCSSISYDLKNVPFPVSASPASDESAEREPFEITGKSVMWVHGLFGESQPDVASLLREHCGECDGVAEFRVEVGTSGHDWFMTHLTLSLVRMKTVTIRGEKLTRSR